MHKKTRTALFITLILLFAVVTPSVILYSQGYRFDFETKQVVQTGGFYFRALPKSANVYLNGKFKAKTSIFTGSTLIENILPKTYSVEIKKTGYHTWQKNLEVKEKQVADAKNVVLFPENPDFKKLTENEKEITSILSQIEYSATSSDKSKLIEPNEHEIWITFIDSRTENSLDSSPKRIFLTRFSEKIRSVSWLNDYYLIFSLNNKIKVAEIDDRDKLNVIDLAEFPSPKIYWDRNKKTLYLVSEGTLYLTENLLP
ncbi:MAG: PEGA domain-containing protein [Candidatus Nealsonbacteria bacterium]|nr:PEGA domain-containing protein [Candidatus Nealsonbacteria bacterium]